MSSSNKDEYRIQSTTIHYMRMTLRLPKILLKFAVYMPFASGFPIQCILFDHFSVIMYFATFPTCLSIQIKDTPRKEQMGEKGGEPEEREGAQASRSFGFSAVSITPSHLRKSSLSSTKNGKKKNRELGRWKMIE